MSSLILITNVILYDNVWAGTFMVFQRRSVLKVFSALRILQTNTTSHTERNHPFQSSRSTVISTETEAAGLRSSMRRHAKYAHCDVTLVATHGH